MQRLEKEGLVGVYLGNIESYSAWKAFYASTYEHAKEAVEMFKKKYPSAVACLTDDMGSFLTATNILTSIGEGYGRTM